MLKTKFASRTDYLNALRENPLELAFVPMSLAAEEIGVKRSTVADLVRAKKLRKVVVSESSLRWSGVQALSLMDYLTNRESLESTSHCQALNILKEQARAGGLIAYGDLLIQLGMSHMNPYERGLIGAILGDISTQTWEKHGFMLSALAVFKGSQRPNAQFFALAEQLGATEDCGDEALCEKFFQKQIRKIFDFYQKS